MNIIPLQFDGSAMSLSQIAEKTREYKWPNFTANWNGWLRKGDQELIVRAVR